MSMLVYGWMGIWVHEWMDEWVDKWIGTWDSEQVDGAATKEKVDDRVPGQIKASASV